MIWLAWRNLFQNPLRLTLSVGGVALALVLMLSLDAIFTGVERQITAYIDHSGADLWVSQSGVRNMHMASSSLPAALVEEIETVEGVESVTPLLYVSNIVRAGEDRYLAYIIGLPEDATAGGPWDVPVGRDTVREGETIIDQTVAAKAGIELGDEVEILGREFEVVGLAQGTANLINSVAFISSDDFISLEAGADAVSFLLVQVEAGEPVGEVAARIEEEIEDVTVQATSDFAAQERRTVKDMSTDVITIMNSIGFLIGLAVTALTVYTATFSRRAEYGVLKALGARSLHLYSTVIVQALLSVALGFFVGLTLTLLLAGIVPRFASNLTLAVSLQSLFKVAVTSTVIAGLSAVMPIQQIARLDPAQVFRR